MQRVRLDQQPLELHAIQQQAERRDLTTGIGGVGALPIEFQQDPGAAQAAAGSCREPRGDCHNPTGKRGWQWVLVTAVVTVFGPGTESIDGCRDRAAGEHLWRHCRERPLRQSVIQRKISLAVQFRPGAICRSELLTVTTTLRQQGRDVWPFMEQAWIAHHRGGVVPSVLPDL